MSKKRIYPITREVEVVLRKVLSYEDALEEARKYKLQGWRTNIYQTGFFHPGTRKEIKDEQN